VVWQGTAHRAFAVGCCELCVSAGVSCASLQAEPLSACSTALFACRPALLQMILNHCFCLLMPTAACCLLLPACCCLQVTHDISHLTCADFLRSPGVQTPVIVRFR
jgi:hypothetical protein